MKRAAQMAGLHENVVDLWDNKKILKECLALSTFF